jgi:hypothetical protein
LSYGLNLLPEDPHVLEEEDQAEEYSIRDNRYDDAYDDNEQNSIYEGRASSGSEGDEGDRTINLNDTPR